MKNKKLYKIDDLATYIMRTTSQIAKCINKIMGERR